MAAPWSRGPASTSLQTRPCWRWVASWDAGGPAGAPDKGSSALYDPGPRVHSPDLVRSRCRASHSPHKAEPFSCHLFSFLVQRPPGLWALEPFLGPLAQRGKGG